NFLILSNLIRKWHRISSKRLVYLSLFLINVWPWQARSLKTYSCRFLRKRWRLQQKIRLNNTQQRVAIRLGNRTQKIYKNIPISDGDVFCLSFTLIDLVDQKTNF